LHPKSVMDAPKQVCLGVVTGPHGVQGAVRIKSFTEEPEDVGRYGPLTDATGARRFELRLIGAAKGVVIARLSGVEDRNQAEALRGLRLYLPRSSLPQTEAEQYYHADLIGLEAVLGDGTPVGRVRAIHDFGAGDTLELARPGAPPVMVPFTRAVVPSVELAAGRLVLDPPPGLLDENEA
jgi:16S rRNA processing protein RimM